MSSNKEFQDLTSLFISDPANAITKSQELICSVTDFDSFKDFYNYYLEHPHISTCQNEWSKPQMSIHCNDCSVSSSSCVCLQCFLNGDHQGHNYLISPSSTGNCDCGDSSLWKKTGFCKKHQGLEDDAHPEDYLDEKLRDILTNVIFRSAFSSLKDLLEDDDEKLSTIFQFLTSFLKFGDGFRRLITISLTEKIDAYELFSHIFEASIEFNQLLQRFCGLLVNDQLFKENFSIINYKLMIESVIPKAFEKFLSDSEAEEDKTEPWKPFWFHSYGSNLFQYNIDHNGWDWVNFCIKGLSYTKEILKIIDTPKCERDPPGFIYYTVDLSDASKIQPNEQTQSLFDKISTEVLPKGTDFTQIITTYKTFTEENNYFSLIYFNTYFFLAFKCFKDKKNLKMNKLIEIFNETIDISKIFYISKNVVESNENGVNENDNLIKSLFNQTALDDSKSDDGYRSFHNGAAFYIVHPTLYSLAHLLRQDNLCRIKIATLLSNSAYRSLRIKIGIAALKSFLSFVCVHQSLASKTNLGANKILKLYTNDPSFASFGIPLLFPLLQLVIGLGDKKNGFSEKEFFAFEIAREIGLFDDFDGDQYNDENTTEIQKQMIFTFLYLSILIVTERTLFNFDVYKFIREQIIFHLKTGHNNLNELNDLYDERIAASDDNRFDLNAVVFDVATARQKKEKAGESERESGGSSDVLFDLKDGIENNFISAINSLNGEKVLMSNEVTKHPDELIKLHQFEDEKDYFFKSSSTSNNNNENDEEKLSKGLRMRLKTFLMTPTVLAVIYHTLRSGSSNIELNDHLAMNILILISKFAKKEEKSDDFLNEITVINYNSKVSDLISQFKKVVFKYEVDNEGNGTITNTLTKKAFKSLLQIKIADGSKEAKSFVDVLLEKGELGKKVLLQMKIKFEGSKDKKEAKQDIIQMKKERARRMKEEIMSHYKSVTANFSTTTSDLLQQDELASPTQSIEGETCSICATLKENEALSYPVCIFRTKFPFIVDKPPLVSMLAKEALNETEVFEDELNDKDEFDEETLDKLEQQIPTVEDLIERFFEEHPSFRITEETSEEAANLIKAFLEEARSSFQSKIDEQHKKIQQKRIELNRKKKMREEKMKEKEAKIDELRKNPDKVVQRRITPGNLFVIQFGICQHLVHNKCVDNVNEFTCPIDRTYKNGLLPNINDLPLESILTDVCSDVCKENFRENFLNSLNSFIENYENFFKSDDNRVVDLFVELVKSISGLIVTYEVRLRNLPDCLDSIKNFILARNLFLATWYSFRMKGKPEMKAGFTDNETAQIDSKLTVFQRFIKELIQSDEIEKSAKKKDEVVRGIVLNLLNQLNESKSDDSRARKEALLFLKRVCLADHFLLKNDDDDNNKESFIDWDEKLSSESLSERYGIEIEKITIDGNEIEFKPFQFMKMPKEFIHFGKSPYNLPVDKTQEGYALSILDYNHLIQHYNDFDDDDDDDEKEDEENEEGMSRYQRSLEHLEIDNLKTYLAALYSSSNYPSVILFITGSASDVAVFNERKMTFLRPFYLDKYGCSDINYKRNQALYLNEERYERIMDEVLSGDFTNNMTTYC